MDENGHWQTSNAIDGILNSAITNVPYRWGEGDFSFLDFGNGAGKGQLVGQIHGTPAFTDTVDAPDKTGANPREDAFYEYILTNRSKSTAENGYVDLSIDDVANRKVTVNANGVAVPDNKSVYEMARGFIADELQIDGYYRYRDNDNAHTKLPATQDPAGTKWTNRAGTVSRLWLYGCDTVVPHASTEEDTFDGVKFRRTMDPSTGEIVVENLTTYAKTVTAPVATIVMDNATIELLVKNGTDTIRFTELTNSGSADRIYTNGASENEAIAHIPLTQAGLQALVDAGANITLRTDDKGAVDFDAIGNVRLLYNTMNAELYETYPEDGLSAATKAVTSSAG